MNAEMKFDSKWTVNARGAFVGTVFDEMENMVNAVTYFSTKKHSDVVPSAGSLHGFWGAVVVESDSFIWLISDVMRSFPVYYSQKNGMLYISNDTLWLKNKSAFSVVDTEAEDEFLATGYVTGEDTLYKELKQLQAGEIVAFQWDDKKQEWDKDSFCYYRYQLRQEYECSHEELLGNFWHELCTVFKRMINYADGRQFVIPLSGGYDSRLIALMLRHFEYNNVVAFSYGVLGNANSAISQQIASELNVPWHFIQYTNNDWRNWYLSNEMRAYEKYAGGFASLPHFQDWPAVKILKNKNLISENAIFVPGHCIEMGLRTGEYPEVYAKTATLNDALNASVYLHYCLNRNYTDLNAMEKYKKRILTRMGDISQYISPASFFECFEQQERQVKYINNSVRVYEFWGYEWWTPLWELDYQNFWSQVPIKEKENRKLYIDNIKKLCSAYNVLGTNGAIRDDDKKCLKNNIKKVCKKLLPSMVYSKLREFRKKRVNVDFQGSPLAYYGCFSEEQLLKHIRSGKNNICGMLADEYIAKIK